MCRSVRSQSVVRQLDWNRRQSTTMEDCRATSRRQLQLRSTKTPVRKRYGEAYIDGAAEGSISTNFSIENLVKIVLEQVGDVRYAQRPVSGEAKGCNGSVRAKTRREARGQERS
jgi:hypothetical protein